jgi:recombination protein RecR
MSAIDRLQQHFTKFPGIGPRQAQRFVYFLMHRDKGYIDQLIKDIEEVRKSVKMCSSCMRYFTDSPNPQSSLCRVCINPARDESELMIVSRDADMDTVEDSHAFGGKYFVLGGTLTFFQKRPDKSIRIDALKKKIHEGITENTLKEIIIATNANPEGEHTADFILSELKNIPGADTLSVTTLGRGLSTGAELEYSDEQTLKSALENRRKI